MFTDEQLAVKTAGGDKEAFAALVHRYEKPIFAFAFRMVGSREDARDIAQEAFLKAFRAIATFKENSRFSPWLYAITNNLCIDFLRRKGRTNLSLDQQLPDGGERQLAGGLDPAGSLEQKETQHLVQKALDFLPVKFKNILVLRHMQELSYEEIAQALGISTSLVKTHLFRARQAMRKQLIILEGGAEHGKVSKRRVGAISGR